LSTIANNHLPTKHEKGVTQPEDVSSLKATSQDLESRLEASVEAKERGEEKQTWLAQQVEQQREAVAAATEKAARLKQVMGR
jgi:hypothetical protein